MQCGQFKDTAMQPLVDSDMVGLCREKDSTNDVRNGDFAPTQRWEGQKKSKRVIFPLRSAFSSLLRVNVIMLPHTCTTPTCFED